jgi:hypothetical protein
MVEQNKENEDERRNAMEFKPKLYIFPNYGQPIGVFYEDEELTDTAFLVLCKRASPEGEDDGEVDSVFIWQGYNFEAEEASEGSDPANKIAGSVEEFKRAALSDYWGHNYQELGLNEVEEEVGEESDEFMAYFD